VVQGFVAAGFGAALIPGLAAGLLSGSFEVLRFEPALPPRVIALAWTRDLGAAPALRAFVAATQRVAGRVWRDRAVEREQRAVAHA
jgi:DNA-binding transcriptional LysR family regulator